MRRRTLDPVLAECETRTGIVPQMDLRTLGQTAPGYKPLDVPDRIRPPPSSKTPQLYPFQCELVDAIRTEFKTHLRVLGVKPTGSGKTTVFSFIAESAASKNKRVYVLVHRVEIVRQIVDRLASFGVRSGQIHPGAARTTWPVQVGMIQTVTRRLDKLSKPDLIVIDEAHHATSGQYKKLLAHWPDVRVLGVTATPLRLDGRGMSEVFTSMVVGPSMRWLIDNGYLADFELFAPSEKIDLKAIRTTAGDYNSADLEVAVNTRAITGNAVEHYARHLNGRPAVAFCINLSHCRAVRDQFRESGWSAEIIDGAMDDGARQALVKRLANGTLNVLVSCNVVNEGFDVPVVAGAIILRPTKSLAMYLQQLGRALRVKPDGSKAVILDHAGNVHKFGPPDIEREWSLEGKMKAEADSRHCSKCERVFAAGAKRSEITDHCTDYETCPLLRIREALPEARAPDVIDGVLTEYKPPEWTKGLPLQSDAGDASYKTLMRRSEGRPERLEEIRKARGYKSAWTHRKMVEFDANGKWHPVKHGG